MTAAAAELTSQIQAALQCMHSPSPPGIIQQAQEALLRWEETHADQYVVGLVSLVGATSTADEERASAATLRLAAVLALKAAVVRRWKDKGRGKVGAPKILLSDGVKAHVRQSMLNLVLRGAVDGQNNAVGFVTDLHTLTTQQLELIQDRPLQTNTASLLSKIARMDLPLKFHELIPTLVEGMKCAQGMKQQQQQTQMQQQVSHTLLYNAMNALEAVLSEISTQRLLVDKKYRNSIAAQYLGPIVETGLMPALQDLDALRGALNVPGEEHNATVQYATLTSRVVSQMMVSSFPKLVEDAAMASLVDQVLTAIHSFLSQWIPCILDSTNANEALRSSLNELLSVHCDLIVNLQQSHPLAFVRYLTPFLSLFYLSLMGMLGVTARAGETMSINLQFSSQFCIAFTTFLANVVGNAKYSEGNDATKDAVKRFFTPAVILMLSRNVLQLFSVHILPNQNIHGGEDDAVQWQDDPEAFFQWELSRSSEDDVGCAAQNLFMALAESSFSNKRVLPWLTELLTNIVSQRIAVEVACGMSSGIDPRAITSAMPLGTPVPNLYGENVGIDIVLQWDAIFTAAGLVGSTLESCAGFSFQQWFDSSLGDCLVLLQSRPQQSIQLPIFHRRIVWLLSCNAHNVTMASRFKPLEMVASILSSQKDGCVRLTAVQALEALLPHSEDWALLNSIIHPTIPALYELTNECSEVDSRSSCLDLLSNLISYVGAIGGTLPNDVLNTTVAPLRTIWANAVDQNLLLRRNVLTILSCIASFVGPESCAVLHPLALPMIDDSFSQPDHVFLVEDALKLWLVFLRLSKTYDPLIGKLFIRAAELSNDLEHVKILMRITEHYVALGQSHFLSDHAATIQSVLSNIVGEVRPRGAAYTFLVIEALLRSYPDEGGSLLQSCGILSKFAVACASSFYEEDKCEPDRVIVLYLTALARIALSTPSVLQSLLPVKLPSGNVFGEEELISLLLLKFQVAGNGAHGLLFQKLWAMLLLSFYPPSQLPTCSNIVLRKSSAIFSKLVYVLKNANHDGTNLLSYEVEYDDDEETVDIGAEMYESLLQEQRAKDIIYTTSLSETVSAKRNGLPNELGQSYQDFLGTIQGDTLRQLEEGLTRK